VESTLEGVIPPLAYNQHDEICDVECLRARYGEVAVLDHLSERFAISQHCVVYVGDGSSDVHMMLHVNRLEGLTIAVSGNKYLAKIAKRTVLSDNALSTLMPTMEDVLSWSYLQIRSYTEQHGFIFQEWEKVETDTPSRS
jgi:predicted HAD superfamily phosphohydrolase